MSWRGRRVTDPKPVVRAPLDDYGLTPTPGLDPVFKGVETAKSQLRNVEHRLTEAERSSVPSSALLDNLSVAVDRVPSFTVNPNAKPSSILVDSMGKTQYLRSREEISRKVSRLEDKFKDKSHDDVLRSKRHETSERKVAWLEDSGALKSGTTTGYQTGTASSLRGLSSLDTRAIDPAGTNPSSLPYNPARTDSGHYKEASVHFLNDREHAVLTKDGGVRGYMDLPGRWTKVDVSVPSGSSASTSRSRRAEKADPLASTYPPKSTANDPETSGLNSVQKGSTQNLGSSGSSTASAPANVNATYTVNGSSSNDSLHFKPKKSLKDLERSSDTLAKLREKVRQQKMASSGESQGSSDDLHQKHNPDDPVIAHGSMISQTSHTTQAIVRKVAAGPPVPRYQGFSEAEMKYSLPDGKMVKVSDIRRRKMKKLKKEAPLKERNSALQKSEHDFHDKKPPKAARVVAAAKKSSKPDRQSDIITARSWRVGAQLVLQELGPNKAPKQGHSPPSKDKSESGTKDARPVTAVPMSSNARAVLNDMESDEEHDDVKDTSKPHRALLKRPKPPPDDETDDAKKQRHYNIDEVKQYIIKQKAERRKQQLQETERQKHTREQRQAQLAELYRRQREVASKPILSSKEETEEINRTRTLDGPSVDAQEDESQKASGESDKENRGGVNSVGAWGDISSADSTLSGGSAESGPGAPQRRDVLSQDVRMTEEAGPSRPDMDRNRSAGAAGSLISKYTSGEAGPSAPGLRSADSGLGTTAPDISKYLKESGINVDQIVTQYAKRAADIGINYNASERGMNSGMGAASSLPSRFRDDPLMTLPNQPLSSTANIGGKNRADRIRALCDNASRLGHRLDTERLRISSMAQAASTGKWAYSREDQPQYISRYDRIAGGRESRTVFDSEIPGIGSLYKSRKTGMMDERRPTSSASDRDYQHLKDSDISDLSDSTLHEDELYKPLALNKPAPKIRLPSSSAKPALGDFGRLRASTPAQWEQPRGDPYSVINVLSRRKDQVSYNPYKRVGLFNDVDVEDMQSDADLTLKSESDHQVSDQLSMSDSTFTGEGSSGPAKVSKHSRHSNHATSNRSISPVSVSQLSGSEADSSLGDYTKSYKEEASHRSASHRSTRNGAPDGALSHRSAISHRSNHSLSQHSRAASNKSASHRSAHKKTTFDAGDVNQGVGSDPVLSIEEAMEVGDDDDDTLEEQSHSPVGSEIDEKFGEQTPCDVEITDVSESSELSVADKSAGNRRAYAPGGISYRSSAVSGRLSPGALERRMTAELNLLESMEESVRQLADVDRTRGVSLAQQETVSLAQVLKAQEQSHKQHLSSFQRDSDLMSREVLRAQQIAADTAEGAARSIETARHETTRSLQDSTMSLIAAQSEATKATAEAARQLSEVKMAASGASTAMNNENASRLIQDTAVATATAVAKALAETRGVKRPTKYDDHSTQYSRRSATPAGADSSVSDSYDSEFTRESTSYRSRSKGPGGSRPESRTSYTMDVDTASPGTGTASVKTGSIMTASDLSRNTASSIATEAGVNVAGSQDNSKSESIMEEVMSEKLNDDYSIDFDTSITEEDMEKSLREVIPSEDHRKKVKKTSSQSDISSVASDDHPPSGTLTPSRRLSFEGDSFTKFTMDMVRQYMREEEIRAQHQAALLKLRERALKEKTQAELAWLEQQKHKVRDKGADESFPLLKKKKRGLLMRLQQEQAEIRRLKEASKAASKERQFLLLQSQEIARLRQSTQQIMRKTQQGHSKVEDWLNDPDNSSLELDSHSALEQVKNKIKESGVEIETDDTVKLDLDESDAFSLASPSKGDLDSEAYAEGGEKKLDLKPLQKLRKMKLDDKFLTHREQQLLQRRMNVEGLLEWKKKLDQEEAEIEAMEKQALAQTRQKEKLARERAMKEAKAKDNTAKEKEPVAAVTPRTPRADTIASELDSIQEESYSESFVSASISRRRTETDLPEDTVRTRASQSSIQEDLSRNAQTVTSIAEDISTAKSGKRTPDSSEDTNAHSTTNEEYTNETFESDGGTTSQTATVTTATAAPGSKKGSSSTPKLSLNTKAEVGANARTAPKSPKSPLKSPSRRGSESESEDSFSLVHSETASDQSDVENRIRALNEDLKRRKSEAEKLKKEAKKKQKDRLRQEEHALKKQIEAYDKYIDQVRTEITENVELQERNAVQPQIKKPTQGQKKSPPTIPRVQPETRSRIDSDGSRSSSSIENGVESPGQTTPLSPITPGDLDEGKGRSFAESVAESLMSPQISALSSKKTSTPEEKSSSRSRHVDKSETIDEVAEEATSMVDLGGEGEESEVQLRLDITKTEDVLDRSKPQGTDATQLPTTARSVQSITEDIPTETKSVSKDLEKSNKQRSKSESKDSKSVKDDESERSESHRTEKSFTYSTTSRSETTYSDEFTEATTGKSSPRRKEPSMSVSKKSQGGASIVESIDTEEEVSEQLDAETDEEGGVMLDLDAIPVQSSKVEVDPLAQLSVGDRVLVGGAQPGTLKFKGHVQFATGYFGGIVLDKPEGTNNGSKEGVRYFECKDNFGIFAPPEKLELLPAGWKDEEQQSAQESDVSEATLHEDEEEDLEKIAELRQDVTKPKNELPEKRSHKDGDESIAEDVSVATTVDSELERVISSAAAAVESFGADDLEARSGAASPVDTTISDSTSLKDQQPQELEKVVDKVTDGILHMVVKDSLLAVSDVAQKTKKPVASDQKPTTADREHKDTVDALESKENQGRDSDKSQAVEVATQKLLNESISQMLNIYKKKQKSSEDSVIQEADSKDDDKIKPITKPSDDEPQTMFENQLERQKKHTDILILDNDNNFDPFGSSTDSLGRADKDDLDQLYNDIEALTGDTDEWFDDDFGLGIKKRAPPPYPGTQDKKEKVDSNELKLDLQKVNQEPFFAVPHKIADVQNLTTSAVEIFWQMRRYGEPWDSVTSPPSSYFAPEDRGQDIESSNRRAYKQLVFELTGEILMDIYRDEDAEEEEQYSWMPQKRTRQKYHRSREPPTVMDLVEPIVEEQVLALVGLKESEKSELLRASKWSSRKKRDRVDNVLLQELVEEEPDWVDYNEDETTVKMQIADSIFDSLLIETAAVFTSIAQKRAL